MEIVTFIEVEKAFERVQRERLYVWNIQKLERLIQNMFENMSERTWEEYRDRTTGSSEFTHTNKQRNKSKTKKKCDREVSNWK